MPTPNVSVPEKQKKMKLPPVNLKPVVVLLSQHAREKIGMPPVNMEKPITFEQLNQYSGLVLYETNIPIFKQDPSILTVDQIKDRAMVYVDRVSFYEQYLHINNKSIKSNLNFLRVLLVFYRVRILSINYH